MKIARINIILRRYRSTDALCSFLKIFPESVWPSSIKSRTLLILGVSRYVLIKKLIATLIPSTIPNTNSPKAKNKNIKIEIKKQKLKRRGNMNLRNFLEYSSSSVLKTVGEVTNTNEIIAPRSNAFRNNPVSINIIER
tara:strand:+ start:431 stop:844 length:414 start_codon:yes stop_codon:yes gene_type:complete